MWDADSAKHALDELFNNAKRYRTKGGRGGNPGRDYHNTRLTVFIEVVILGKCVCIADFNPHC